MSQSIETQTLMAYIDGELESAEQELVEQALKQQPQLQSQFDRLSHLNNLLGEALSPALQGEPPELRRPKRLSGGGRLGVFQLSWWQRFSVVPVWQSGAAVVVLVVGVLIGSGYERQLQQGLLAQQQQLQQAIDQALETHLSGDSLYWGEGRGSVTPVRTYRSRRGQFCREYVYRTDDPSLTNAQRGVACRDGQGWQVKANYYL